MLVDLWGTVGRRRKGEVGVVVGGVGRREEGVGMIGVVVGPPCRQRRIVGEAMLV